MQEAGSSTPLRFAQHDNKEGGGWGQDGALRDHALRSYGLMARRMVFSSARRAWGRGNPGRLARRMVREDLPASGRRAIPRWPREPAARAGMSVAPYPAATRLTSVSRVPACMEFCKALRWCGEGRCGDEPLRWLGWPARADVGLPQAARA